MISESKTKQFKNFPDHDSKYDLKNLSNSQRILLGLKVASMKCKPVNMHQFENKQKVDILSLISSIVHPPTLDSRDREISTEDNCYFKVIINFQNCSDYSLAFRLEPYKFLKSSRRTSQFYYVRHTI